jgi:Mg-chelatase subunit ChlD
MDVKRSPVVLACALLLAAPAAADRSMVAAPVQRTVFVTVTDGKGNAVPGLTPADFAVKEGGKEREILKAEPASARMRLALALEERLIGHESIRLSLFEFVKRLVSTADISLITVGLSNTTVVDYTSSLETLVGALNKLTFRGARDSNLAEGVLEIARTFASNRVERPVIVVVSLTGGQISVDPRAVLDKLGESGATMHAALVISNGGTTDETGREQVLDDGPRQSGGRRVDVRATTAMPNALQQIADGLLAQYAITYALPDGVKPDKRLSVSLKRRGASLRAPSTIPTR